VLLLSSQGRWPWKTADDVMLSFDNRPPLPLRVMTIELEMA
jgi:hypothetical protein